MKGYNRIRTKGAFGPGGPRKKDKIKAFNKYDRGLKSATSIGDYTLTHPYPYKK